VRLRGVGGGLARLAACVRHAEGAGWLAPCERTLTEATVELPLPSPFRFLLACVDRLLPHVPATGTDQDAATTTPLWPYARRACVCIKGWALTMRERAVGSGGRTA
jgi:hypothetical protein